MILYHVERLRDIHEELKPLIENHWKEVALNQGTINLNVNWDAFFQMDDDGRLHCSTAREGDKLVGYFVNIIVPHLHYADHLFSHNDAIYVDPSYRKEQLTIAGVSVMMINTKMHKPFDRLLQRLNFVGTETIYSKRLGVN